MITKNESQGLLALFIEYSGYSSTIGSQLFKHVETKGYSDK